MDFPLVSTGLVPEEQEQIWERFHRVRGVEVQTGQSATFWFTLPLSHTDLS
jgi:hypothetical protein